MTDEKSSPLVPTLRFPEFREAGEWMEKKLREIACEFIDGDWIESKDQSSNGVRLIQTGNIGVGEFILKPENARYVSEDTFKRLKCNEVFPNDCLISRLPDPAGRSCLLPNIGQKMITVVDCTIVRFHEYQITPYFFVIFSQTDRYCADVERQCSGSTRQRISRDNLSHIKITLPALPEQQKIAACLSSLDELITAHSQKLDALKKHKKGLMQQLFPAEGQTVPSLRFPEFSEAGEWEIKQLGEICNTFLNGGTPSTQKTEFWQGKIPWITGADVVNQKVTNIRRFITEEAVKNSSTNIVKKDSLLIVTRTGVGKIAIAPFDLAISQDLTGIYVNNEQSSTEYLYEFLNSNSDKIKSMNQGTSIAGITRESLIEIKISLPSLPEQQKIAACLSSLDEFITAHSKKLDALKKHKKGLMQQLFPAVEED